MVPYVGRSGSHPMLDHMGFLRVLGFPTTQNNALVPPSNEKDLDLLK